MQHYSIQQNFFENWLIRMKKRIVNVKLNGLALNGLIQIYNQKKLAETNKKFYQTLQHDEPNGRLVLATLSFYFVLTVS